MEETLVRVAQELRRRLEDPGATGEVSALVAELHPADLAELLYELPEPLRPRLFALLDPERAALTLQELDPEMQSGLLGQLGDVQASDILEEMSTDEIADMVGEMPEPEAERVLELMDREEAEDVQELLEFREDSAGGIMTPEFIALRDTDTVEQAIEQLRRLAPDAETAYYLYVVDEQERLVGVVSLRELIIAQPATAVGQIMQRKVIAASVDDDQEEVAKLVAKYNLLAVPVVDASGRLRGIVTFDDVIDVIQEEATEDIYKLAGTGEVEEDVAAGAWETARRRLPWLVGLLFGELLASQVINSFNETLEAYTALAFFIPVLIGMGGNVATQSLAVTVRGLATGELDGRGIWRSMVREAVIGSLVGLSCGVIMFLVAWVWRPGGVEPLVMGGIVGVAMAADMIFAAGLGSFFPFILERLGADPAIASGPFVTTLMDVLGMIIYFTVATSLLAVFGGN